MGRTARVTMTIIGYHKRCDDDGAGSDLTQLWLDTLVLLELRTSGIYLL